MSVTRAIGNVFGYVLRALVHVLTLSRVHPNVLTTMGLAINGVGAWMLARGEFFYAGIVVLCGAVFDLVDGPVARKSNQVTRFGGFLDSVIDRYSDLILLTGLLFYYASIDRFFYIVLTAVAMTGSVLVSYTRARAENEIEKCKVGFLERPERIVLLLIGLFANRIAPVLWVIAVLSNITVLHRIIHTWRVTDQLDREAAQAAAEMAPAAKAARDGKQKSGSQPASRELPQGYPSA